MSALIKFRFDLSKACTPYEARKGQIAKENFKGVYIGLRGFIREGDRAGRWAIKVGEGFGKKGILGRADDQALSLAFGFNAREVDRKVHMFGNPEKIVWSFERLERALMRELDKRFGGSPLAHNFAGATETYGDFATPEEAYHAAELMLAELHLEDWTTNQGEDIGCVDFWRLTS